MEVLEMKNDHAIPELQKTELSGFLDNLNQYTRFDIPISAKSEKTKLKTGKPPYKSYTSNNSKSKKVDW